ncbi:MAG TPA: response regulator [Desulfomonilaceae bacterium]|nr:response regulator [Desulfomonilaceae bacterium]
MNIKVLLVDDEEEFVEILAERLEFRGFSVSTAFNGDDAVSCLKEHEPDVVILDVLMPGKDGIQTLKEIKQINPLVEVIMLTGHATVGTAIEGMKLGAYNYLIKPSDTEDLVAKIMKAYKLKSEHEERIRSAELESVGEM